MTRVGDVVNRTFKLVFVVIFLALVIVWIWNPIAARFSLPLLDVFTYLPALLVAGIVLFLAKVIFGTDR
jgi:hypothetical protein